MRLNRHEPYGEVYGVAVLPGAKFEQHGRYFRHDGSLIGEPPAEAERVEAVAVDDFRAMSVDRLKQLANIYAIDWTTKADVIRQLEGRA